MDQNLKTGKLIVIDGIDGSGKATQAKILREKLTAAGHSVESLDFPQYTQNFFGGIVRNYLDGKFGMATQVDPHLASVLYAADRWESSSKIQQWLSDGKVVILDRYMTSNLIHQGAKLSEPELDEFITWLYKMEFDVFKIPKPELVIFLHVPAELSYQLIMQRGQGLDGHDTMDHLKIAEQRCFYMANKLNWKIIECCDENKQLQSIEKVSEKIWELIQEK